MDWNSAASFENPPNGGANLPNLEATSAVAFNPWLTPSARRSRSFSRYYHFLTQPRSTHQYISCCIAICATQRECDPHKSKNSAHLNTLTGFAFANAGRFPPPSIAQTPSRRSRSARGSPYARSPSSPGLEGGSTSGGPTEGLPPGPMLKSTINPRRQDTEPRGSGLEVHKEFTIDPRRGQASSRT
jgi:hypothetical protein